MDEKGIKTALKSSEVQRQTVDFAEKIRFSLLLLSPRVLAEKVRDGGGQLTVTTLNAWRAGQNLPSYQKLRQFSDHPCFLHRSSFQAPSGRKEATASLTQPTVSS